MLQRRQHARRGAAHFHVALTNVTLPYALKIANMGAEAAMKADPALKAGLNVYKGYITYEGVREAYPELPYKSADEVLK